ncbi:MAG: ornithine carbamoyltransferase [Vampirovibrionales bacterium]|nr:ornithine carbamoyltransferase [Vampirovibrionales bacterium]
MTLTLQPPPRLQTPDFLAVADLSPEELSQLLAYAAHLKALRKARIAHPLLQGRSVALYFEKPSNRTRVSFEVGVADLGAHPFMLRKDEVNLGVRETIADTARTLSRYVDGIMIRTFSHSDVEQLADYASVPVINGLTDAHHPCQILADLLTVRERFGELQGLKLAFIGDGNNIAHSLLEGCALAGMRVAIACPKTHAPLPEIVSRAQQLASRTPGASVLVTDNLADAVEGAAAVYTDVWISMGQEKETAERRRIFEGYQVNESLMRGARPDAVVLHCLPAHRGEEISAETFEKHADVIFDEAENRLHAQKAVMAALMAPR